MHPNIQDIPEYKPEKNDLYYKAVEIFSETHKKCLSNKTNHKHKIKRMVVIEGEDKSGKTTFISYIGELIKKSKKLNINFIKTKDYVYTPNKDVLDLYLQFLNYRYRNLVGITRENKTADKYIIYDRYIYSTFVYQIMAPLAYPHVVSQEVHDILFSNERSIMSLIENIFIFSYGIMPDIVLIMERKTKYKYETIEHIDIIESLYLGIDISELFRDLYNAIRNQNDNDFTITYDEILAKDLILFL